MTAEVLPAHDTRFGARVRERLQAEKVVWFTTVGRDGTPQPNPVWFLWDGGDQVLTYNRPDAVRLTHIAQRPQVSLHFNSGEEGDDIVVLRGRAERLSGLPAPDASAEYLAKYRDDMIRVSGSLEAFAAVYSEPVRIQVTRVRGW